MVSLPQLLPPPPQLLPTSSQTPFIPLSLIRKQMGNNNNNKIKQANGGGTWRVKEKEQETHRDTKTCILVHRNLTQKKPTKLETII